MKYILYLSTFFLFCIQTTGFSQNVAIPDTSFKKALIKFGVDTNSDKEISISEAIAVDSLVVSKYDIKKLKGIEAFVNLTYFNCEENLLDTIDLTFNTKLKTLDISTNTIKFIDLTHNSKLEHVRAQNDYRLQKIDFTNCPELISFDATSNDLRTLDLTHNAKLQSLEVSIRDVPSIDLSKNTELIKLSLIYAYLIPELDLSHNTKIENFSLSLTQTIKTIDFRPCTLLKGIFMTNNDKIEAINVSNLSQLNYIRLNYSPFFTGIDVSTCLNLTNLDINSNNISSLNIAKNKRLKSLACGRNNFTEINISALDSLTRLECNNNKLVNLDISKNKFLSTLICNNNKLTALDFTNNLQMSNLYCSNNLIPKLSNLNTRNISSLSCSNNLLTELVIASVSYFSSLDCSNNKLSTLDLSKGNILYIYSFNSKGNPDLTCIQVSDTVLAKTKWSTGIDPQSQFKVNCGAVTGINDLTIPFSSTTVFPNPSIDGLFSISNTEFSTFRLLSSVGHILAEGQIEGNILDFSTQEKGFYNLLLFNGVGGSVRKKILIK